MYIIKVEEGVWCARGDSAFSRSIVFKNAQTFKTIMLAEERMRQIKAMTHERSFNKCSIIKI